MQKDLNSKPLVIQPLFGATDHCALCNILQKQLFRNIYKPFLYLLYNNKYLLVVSHLGAYPLCLIVTYNIISAPYALLVHDSRPFPNLLVHQILLFCLYLRKYINNLVIHPQKSTLAKFKAEFYEFLTFNFTVKPLLKLSQSCLDSFL